MSRKAAWLLEKKLATTAMGQLPLSAEEFVKVVVRSDPDPDHCIPGPLTDVAILFVDSN